MTNIFSAYPDCVVLAARNHPPRRGLQYSDGLLVGTLHWASELTADDVFAAVTGRGGHAASSQGTCRDTLLISSYGYLAFHYLICNSENVLHLCAVAGPRVCLFQQWRNPEIHSDELLQF